MLRGHIEIIKRHHAEARNLEFYFTGKLCSKGYIGRRYVRGHRCAERKSAPSRDHRNLTANLTASMPAVKTLMPSRGMNSRVSTGKTAPSSRRSTTACGPPA